MTDYMDVNIKGLQETFKALEELGSTIQRKAAVDMTRSTASSLARVVRKNCPIGTKTRIIRGKKYEPGNLKKSIAIRRYKKGDLKKVYYMVGFTYGKKAKYDGFYAHLVEFGSGRHPIPRKGFLRKKLRIGQNIFTGPIEHPGHVGSRFVTRSFEEGYGKAMDTGVKAFKRALTKYAR